MSIQHLVAAVALSGIAAFSSGCVSHCCWGDDPAKLERDAKKHTSQLLKELGADESQSAAVFRLTAKLVPQISALAKGQNEARAKVLAAFASDTPDGVGLHDLLDQRIDAVRKFSHEALNAALELHTILRPEQRKTLVEHLDDDEPCPIK